MVNDAFVLPRAAGRDSSADLRAQLATAFASELDARLPRLLPAAGRLRRRGCQASAATVRSIVAEVHTIASSAVVVGAHRAAQAARACEHRLLAYTEGAALPAVVVDEALDRLDELVAALADWRSAQQPGVA